MANSSKGSSSASSSTTTSTSNNQLEMLSMAWIGTILCAIYLVVRSAYNIRLGAINEFGPVIHEFDPYFNYRATEFLYWNGWKRFFTWFDHRAWYPLGRPVGTTIYPGMQFTAVAIKNYVLPNWSLNDVCCYIPAWFGVIASAIVGLIAYEASIPQNTSSNVVRFVLDVVAGKKTESMGRSVLFLGIPTPAIECAIFSMAMMAIVPAHLMRSMGGGYDNESVAVSAMVFTFYCWMRSLRSCDPTSHWVGIITGLAYFYMVAAWGGYVFVLNLIGTHAAVLMLTGRFSYQVYMSYTLFYSIGTILAIQVPVVGKAPLRSLEQLGPGAVFVGYQLLQLCETIKRRQGLSRQDSWKLRTQVFGAALCILLVVGVFLTPRGYFGPISARVRGLFVKHTKTGNPLVDSVAEHQPASSHAYFQYLHHVCTLAPLGYLIVFFQLSDASSFLLVWSTAAYFFSHKMVRLILLTAPIGSALAGIAAGRIFAWCLHQWWEPTSTAVVNGSDPVSEPSDSRVTASTATVNLGKKKGKKGGSSKSFNAGGDLSSFEGLVVLRETLKTTLKTKEGILAKRVVSCLIVISGLVLADGFAKYCWRLSIDLSNPSIILKARTRNGEVVMLDDYREAYWWLRDNTPDDARVMAWWDYGYQISAIANRTTIADGNTWNHEHIALLGKTLTSELDEGWEIARHLADYVLVWAGGGGDDLAKSPHLARIANSVYRDHCGSDDPTCRAFGFLDRQGTPSAMMARSLLFRLHSYQVRPEVQVPEEKFQEVYRSRYAKVRIYKIIGISEESKEWIADPANRKCDFPGSWFCPGQYPPALDSILARKRDFGQLEDFNRGDHDEEYTKRYFEDLLDPESARRKMLEKERIDKLTQKEDASVGEDNRKAGLDPQVIERIYNSWEDTDDTTRMWQLISANAVEDLKLWLEVEPHKAFIRSKDGRGPMWWAMEMRNEEMTRVLMKAGVPHTDRDAKGLAPVDLLQRGAQ